MGFATLVQIYIFRAAACRSDNNICLLFNMHACHCQKVMAAFFPRFIPVPGNNFMQVAFGAEHHVYQKRRVNFCAYFRHILVQRVIFQNAGFAQRIAACTNFICQCHSMVVHNGSVAAYARHNSFAPAAKACHRVQ